MSNTIDDKPHVDDLLAAARQKLSQVANETLDTAVEFASEQVDQLRHYTDKAVDAVFR